MINAELSRMFDRIADLMEIEGDDRFRVNSYRRVSRMLDDLTEDVAAIAAEGRLTDLPTVGKGMADRIQQYLNTGHIDVLDELLTKLPPGLTDLLAIPGLGPKKVALVYKQLGVKNRDDLKKVIESGEMAKLPGLGETSVKKIAEGMTFLESDGNRTPLGLATPIAETFAERVSKLKGVRRVEIAGSLRRGCETIGDIDLVCDADHGEEIVKQFVKFGEVQRILAAGATKGSVVVAVSGGKEVQVDLRVVDHDSYGAAVQYFTGSKQHNVRLRELAIKKGWRLNEYGLHENKQRIAGKTEEEIYQKLKVPFVPPELREDRGEFEPAAAELTKSLVTLDDIRGDLHMHTTASDGLNSIEEMAGAAKKLGYEYIAICDHSKSATIANGLSIERMEKHIEDIHAANKKVKGIAILAGCECDILPNGNLDYPDELLAKCDWVVASIHAAMGAAKDSKKRSPTERTVAAMENPYVRAIGHPTGRLINRRPAMELDMPTIIQAAVRTGTFLEVNASWHRLDLKDMHIRQALAAGVTIVIDTDAHSTGEFLQMRFGVTTARRGGARKQDVLNTLPISELRKRIKRKQGK